MLKIFNFKARERGIHSTTISLAETMNRWTAMNKLQSLKWNVGIWKWIRRFLMLWAYSSSTFQPQRWLDIFFKSLILSSNIWLILKAYSHLSTTTRNFNWNGRQTCLLHFSHSVLYSSQDEEKVAAKTHWLSDVASVVRKLSVSWRDAIPKINSLDILLSTIFSHFYFLIRLNCRSLYSRNEISVFLASLRLLYYQCCSSMSLSCLSNGEWRTRKN